MIPKQSENQSNNLIRLAQEDNGKKISLSKDTIFMVRLKTFAGTGYDWFTSQLDSSFLVEEKKTHSSHSQKMGAQTDLLFLFRVIKTGSTRLVLEHRRVWEKDIPAAETFSIELEIFPKKDT